MQYNWFSRFVFASVVGLVLVLCIVFANAYLESSLMTSLIIQHLIFIMVGLLFAYAAFSVGSSGLSVRLSVAYESVLRKVRLVNRYGVLSFAAAGLVIFYWDLPSNFDAAITPILLNL